MISEKKIKAGKSRQESEPLKQRMEILLSHDFDNMELDTLKSILDEYRSLRNECETFYSSKEHVESLDYLYFLIEKKESKEEMVKVGDLFQSSWGYDQTNVEFFKVKSISKSGKTCHIVEVTSEKIHGSEGFMSDSVTPIPEKELNGDKTCRVRIEMDAKWNPRRHQTEKIDRYHLRGSVFYGCGHGSKHLRTLSRVDPTKSSCRSWYA